MTAYGPRASPSPAMVAEVAAHYRLGEAVALRDLGGTYHLNLLLHTSHGRYVLRAYRPWVVEARLDLIQRVRAQLPASGLPAVPAVTAPDGSRVLRYDGRLIEVEHHFPNAGGADSWSRYESALPLLGRLHDALADITAGVVEPAPAVHNYAEPAAAAAGIAQTRAVVAARGASDAVAACDAAAEYMARIQTWWDEGGRLLPRGAVHGDFGADNLLYRDATPAAVLDFDFLDVHERSFDVAYSLYWAFERVEGDQSPADRSWHRVGDLLDRYSSAARTPLTPAERRAMPMQLARVPLYWFAEAALVPDPVAAVRQRIPTLAVARWLLDHWDDQPQPW